jgi:hypothetical protein
MKTKKKKVGRPLIKEREDVKTKFIGFRVDPSEHDKITAAADERGISKSEFCKYAVFNIID